MFLPVPPVLNKGIDNILKTSNPICNPKRKYCELIKLTIHLKGCIEPIFLPDWHLVVCTVKFYSVKKLIWGNFIYSLYNMWNRIAIKQCKCVNYF